MGLNRTRLVLLAVTWLFAPSLSMAVCTPFLIGPGKFVNPGHPWNGTDTGVVVDRFVDLRDEGGQVVELRHGTDLSSNNTVDYAAIATCGGAFAFVRVDNATNAHADGFFSQKVTVMPYVYFPIGKQLRRSGLYSSIDRDDTEKRYLAERFTAIARTAADSFITKYQALRLSGMKQASLIGAHGVPVALDVEEKLLDEGSSRPAQRQAYGRFYAMAVVAWIAEAEAKMPSARIILYTTPSVYEDY